MTEAERLEMYQLIDREIADFFGMLTEEELADLEESAREDLYE